LNCRLHEERSRPTETKTQKEEEGMLTAVAPWEPLEAREPPLPAPLPEAEWQTSPVEYPPERRGKSAVILTAQWAAIIGLLAVAGLRARVAPVEVVARFIVDAGAILMMARALLRRRYAVAVVSAAVAVLYNPLAPVFELSGGWQRTALVAIATPFLAALIWRDVRMAHYEKPL
jgi:hypothetical protein